MAKGAKGAKAEKSERQKVLDDLRRKQRGADRARGFAIVGVCIVVAALIVGFAAYRPIANWWEARQYADVALASIGADADVCTDVEEQAAEGNQEHVPTGQFVQYDQAPPAFGAHYNEAGIAPDPIGNRFYSEDRPELGSLVHNLEHGYTILWYDETAADDSGTMNQIRAIVDKLNDNDTNLRLKFKAVPWTAQDDEDQSTDGFPGDNHIALTAWTGTGEESKGATQYCTEPSGAAVEQFMRDYPFTKSPEPYGG